MKTYTTPALYVIYMARSKGGARLYLTRGGDYTHDVLDADMFTKTQSQDAIILCDLAYGEAVHHNECVQSPHSRKHR